MKSALKGAIIAIGIGLGVMEAIVPANAAGIGLSLNFGDVALGYQSGYYDHHRHWHHWRNRDEWRGYNNYHRSHWRHGRRSHHHRNHHHNRHNDHHGHH